MGIVTDYVIPSIVGAFISIFMDTIVVHYVKVALCSEQMLESLAEKVNKVITDNFFRRVKEQTDSMTIGYWDEKLQEFLGRASTMMQERRGLNVFSRYRRIKDITNLISDVDIYFKLVPLIQLECVLSQSVHKRRLPTRFLLSTAASGGDWISGIVGWVITSAFMVMLFWIKTLHNFKKKLESFKDLVDEINYIIYFIKEEIVALQRVDDASDWLNNARNWVEEMDTIVGEGIGIEDTWSPIARCKKSKEITELTSKIDAHLNKLSWINLELLFHEIEPPSRIHLEILDEIEPPPLETEGSTSHRPPPQETEGWIQLEILFHEIEPPPLQTEGSTSHSTSPEETEGSRSQQPTPIQGDGSSSA